MINELYKTEKECKKLKKENPKQETKKIKDLNNQISNLESKNTNLKEKNKRLKDVLNITKVKIKKLIDNNQSIHNENIELKKSLKLHLNGIETNVKVDEFALNYGEQYLNPGKVIEKDTFGISLIKESVQLISSYYTITKDVIISLKKALENDYVNTIESMKKLIENCAIILSKERDKCENYLQINKY